MSLFRDGVFTSHSGLVLPWKIDCDALTEDDWRCVAQIVARRYAGRPFRRVVGVPTGGLKLAACLQPFVKPAGKVVLIVDDVITTGRSLEEAALRVLQEEGCERLCPYPGQLPLYLRGFALFARSDYGRGWTGCGVLPSYYRHWCGAMFRVGDEFMAPFRPRGG